MIKLVIKRQIKVAAMKRMAKSLRREKQFNKLDDIEIDHLIKAYRNMPKHSFKTYLLGFLNATMVLEETIVIVKERDVKND